MRPRMWSRRARRSSRWTWHPQLAYANIQALRTLCPGMYGAEGFFDAVNPATGAARPAPEGLERADTAAAKGDGHQTEMPPDPPATQRSHPKGAGSVGGGSSVTGTEPGKPGLSPQMRTA